MSRLTALIVDDHEIIRLGVRSFFAGLQEPKIEIVGEANNGRSAIQMAEQVKPQIVIMDISMPELNGIEAADQIRKVCPGTKIIVLSMHNNRRFVREMIKTGISAYVLKSCIHDDLCNAIKSAINGDIYLSPKVSDMVTEDYLAILNNRQLESCPLSSQQKEILQMIAEGRSTKEIATSLNLSSKAVESTRHRIMQKLGITNIATLTKYAIQEGLTTLDF